VPNVRTIVVANPFFDVYGSDLQMLESVRAFRGEGWRVVVFGSADGPLRTQLLDLGAEPRVLDYPVLKRGYNNPKGIASLAGAATAALPRMRRAIEQVGADLCYVNTVTLPWWLAAGRRRGCSVLCHVHEAEPDESRWVRRGMSLPLFLADAVAVNSTASLDALCGAAPRLRKRSHLVYNGVPGPDGSPEPSAFAGPVRIVSVGRLAPRKGPDLALEAVGHLVARGYDVHLELCGTVVPGQEDFLRRLEQRAAQPDLAGRVTFSGYSSPVWPALAGADVFLAAARAEPFGNAVVEAQLALRPVVATAVQGHLETVRDGETGFHARTEDAASMADAVARLIDDPELARRLAARGRANALDHFSTDRYRTRLLSLVESLLGGRDETAGGAPRVRRAPQPNIG
jgi:glycosyltransferase involved in cell wall biosynthesis